MSAPQFTPGPWEAEDTASQQDRWMVKGPHPFSDTNKYGVARGIEHVEDARLLAAAPELYEAAFAFLLAYGGGETDEQLAPLVIELGRALRKARGEQ